MKSLHIKSGAYIPSLDGIRAVAAMLVFVAHAGWEHLVPGGFGVTIFFFLSGYLITTLLRREFEHSGSISFSKFYLRRAYRIFPPLYIVLTIALVLALAGINEHQVRPWAMVSEVLFWTNYYNIFYGGHYFVPGTVVYWSLAVEEHFYLLFPLIFWVIVRRMSYIGAARFLSALCLLALAWRCWLFIYAGVSAEYTYSATDARFDSLLFGCVLGLWMNPVADPDWKIDKRGRQVVLAFSLAILLVTFLYRDEVFRQTFRYTLQGIALFPIFWLAVRHPDWAVFRWLNWRPVRFLGAISFTFYLSHLLMLSFANHWVSGRISIAFLGFSLTLIFASTMYFLIERPIAGLRRRLHND